MLQELSKERVFDEIKKLLLKSDRPSLGFKLLKELGALDYFYELGTLNKEDWNLTLKALDNMSRAKTQDNKTNLVLMLALTCYKFSELQIIAFLSRLTADKEIFSRVLALTQNVLKTKMSNSELHALAQYVSLEDIVAMYDALYERDKELYDKLKTRAFRLGVLNKKLEPLLQGRDLLKYGLAPSKEFSKILTLAYEAQMREEFKNQEEAIAWLDKKLLS